MGAQSQGSEEEMTVSISDSPAAERSVLMALALLELAVPILTGWSSLSHSTVQLRGVDVPQTVWDEKEVSA